MSETKFHNITVEKVMNRVPPLIEQVAPIGEVAKIVCQENHVWVVGRKDSKRIVGVVTEKDLLDIVSPLPLKSYTIGVITPKSLHHIEFETAGDIMTKPVIKCHPAATLEEALRLMTKHRIRRLAVTENDEIIGELSLKIVISTYFSV